MKSMAHKKDVESFKKTFIENLNFKIAAVENQTGKIKASEAELMAKVEKAVWRDDSLN